MGSVIVDIIIDEQTLHIEVLYNIHTNIDVFVIRKYINIPIDL